jgi:hypothetical protein
MFENLDDRMKSDDRKEVTPAQRRVQTLLVAILSVVLFGALYYGIRTLG